MNRSFGIGHSQSLVAGASVVVPSYNHAPFIERCLQSIIKQTLTPVELIVIDDGSSDDSPQIIGRVLRDCSFPCELIVRENRGLCATLNEGLARSRGEFFTYLGSDDMWLPQMLEERVSLLKERPHAVLAYGHYYRVNEDDEIIGSTRDWGVEFVDGDAREMLLKPVIPQSSTSVYRRDLLSKFGWNEKAKLEDYELFLRLSAKGPFALGEKTLSAWRYHGYNTSRDVTMMMQEFVAAQNRVAGEVGINPEQLKSSRRAINFNAAGDLLMSGQRGRATLLTLKNIRAASSVSIIARRALRLLLPLGVMRRREQQLRRQCSERYGSVQI